ncbi:Hypothetical predicted protein [Xyrichtys novacula]|uniref:Uncharacterized protein n=1 Tax=Xyrichtys novacula TaxID=13765 RepID=A0AAV1HBD6_XYRNO|nr:Hypothetical predicted protein [Xyrichtys novacula]
MRISFSWLLQWLLETLKINKFDADEIRRENTTLSLDPGNFIQARPTPRLRFYHEDTTPPTPTYWEIDGRDD